MAKVVLDPSHGGVDSGAVGPSGKCEKDVSLAIVRYAANYLVSCGVEVILTRNDDVYVSLYHRCAKANAAGADCFVSVHANADNDGTARGVETWYHHNSTKGKQLAAYLQVCLTDLGLSNRKLKDDYYFNRPEGGSDGLYVLRETAMPAALIEVAFISNPHEETWLAESDNQDKTGKAIAKGICRYLNIPFVEEGSNKIDNEPNSWAEKSWKKAIEKGVFSATEPKKVVTREMLAVILDRLGLLN